MRARSRRRPPRLRDRPKPVWRRLARDRPRLDTAAHERPAIETRERGLADHRHRCRGRGGPDFMTDEKAREIRGETGRRNLPEQSAGSYAEQMMQKSLPLRRAVHARVEGGLVLRRLSGTEPPQDAVPPEHAEHLAGHVCRE